MPSELSLAVLGTRYTQYYGDNVLFVFAIADFRLQGDVEAEFLKFVDFSALTDNFVVTHFLRGTLAVQS